MVRETKTIFGVVIKATPKQLERIYDLWNKEQYWTDEFHKYFHVWICDGSGVYYFIKEKYFVELNCETNYAVALLQRFGGKDVSNRVIAH